MPAPGQGQVSVLVEVSAVSLGTERARWLGLPGAAVRYPHQPGYSLAGTVHAVGPGVYDIEPGTPVAVWGAPHQSLVTVDRAQVHALAERRRSRRRRAGHARAPSPSSAWPGRGTSPGARWPSWAPGAIGLLAQRIGAAEGAKPCTVVAASTAKDAVVAGDPAAVSAPPAAVDGLGADVVIEATGAAAGLDLAAARRRSRRAPWSCSARPGPRPWPSPSTSSPPAALRVVGAHAGLLDAPGGTAGLDRRSAAQRFLDRVATGAVRVDDLVTFHADPAGAADLLDRVGADRTQVVPVIEWWRLAPDLRARAGGLDLPNPFRRGLAVPLRARRARAVRPPRHRRPPAGAAAAGAAEPVVGGWSADAGRRGPGGAGGRRVRDGRLAGGRRGAGPGRGSAGRGGPGAGLTDVAAGPDGDGGGRRSSSTSTRRPPRSPPALSALGPDGVLLVAGRVGRVELDVQTDVHRRGATVAGVPAPQGGAVQDG